MKAIYGIEIDFASKKESVYAISVGKIFEPTEIKTRAELNNPLCSNGDFISFDEISNMRGKAQIFYICPLTTEIIDKILEELLILINNKEYIIDVYKKACSVNKKVNHGFHMPIGINFYGGVCQFLNYIGSEIRFHVAQKFIDKNKLQSQEYQCVVYPIGNFCGSQNDVWTNELRWEYVQFWIDELNTFKKMIGNGE